MLIIRGVNVYPSQVEAILLELPELTPNYRIVVERTGTLDAATVEIETAQPGGALREHAERLLLETIGCSIAVHLKEPGTLPRFRGWQAVTRGGPAHMKLCMFTPIELDLERGWPGKLDGDRVIQVAAQTLEAFFTGGGTAREHAVYPLAEVRFLVPVLRPPAIRIFDGSDFHFGNPTSLYGPDEDVPVPLERVEALLRPAAVIGAQEQIGGFTAMNDWHAPELEGARRTTSRPRSGRSSSRPTSTLLPASTGRARRPGAAQHRAPSGRRDRHRPGPARRGREGRDRRV